MVLDINDSFQNDPLANEANLIALLGSDDAPVGPNEPIDAELALQALLGQAGVNQLILRRSEDDGESLVAYFRLSLGPEQQRVVWHIPVAPALTGFPECQAEVEDGVDARVRFTNVQKFGVRAELILNRPAQTDRHVLVTINIRSV